MRRVHLQHVEADAQGAFRGGDVGIDQAFQLRLRQLMRRMPAVAERDRRRPDRRPGRVLRPERLAAFPRHLRRRLASRVAELDADRILGDAAIDLHRARHRGLVVVAIKAGAAVRDAPFAGDVRLLDHEQARSRAGEGAQVREVPVGHRAVVGRVLAHRRDDDAVRERDAAELDRREQLRGQRQRCFFP